MIITGLLIGLVLGFVFQRGRFCVTGAFRDIFIAGSTRWFSAFILLIAVHAVGLMALNTLGIITLETDPFPWLASIVGGFIFGFAIILAGGCATGPTTAPAKDSSGAGSPSSSTLSSPRS